MANIDGFSLEIPGARFETGNETPDAVKALAMAHLRDVVLGSIPQVLGSIGIFGHPAISASSAATGVGDFMKGLTFQSENPLGSVLSLSNSLLASLTSFATLPASFGKFFASLSGDREYQLRREEILKSAKETSLSGSARLLFYSLVRPIFIIGDGVRTLVQGEVKNGSWSIGKGLIDTVVLPIAGASDAVAVWMRGYDMLLMPSNLHPRRYLRVKKSGLCLPSRRHCFWAYVFYSVIDRQENEIFESFYENSDNLVLVWSTRRVGNHSV